MTESVSVAGVEFTLVPYDPTALLDSLEDSAPVRKPAFPALMDTLRFYTAPDPAEARDIHQLWMSVRSRVRATSDSLYAIEDRASTDYRDLYGRFRLRYDDLVQREAALERALRAVSADHAALARRAMDAADSVRAWESTALARYDSLATARQIASNRESISFRLNPDELTTLSLAPGPWWLVARLQHPKNPFFEYVWELSFTVSRVAPASVPIRDHDVTLRWRH